MSTIFQDFENYCKQCPIVAILRGIKPDEVTAVADILFNAGIRLLEIPLNSPDPFSSISTVAKHTQGRMLAGAGTVLTPDEVRKVDIAGGKFIISPNTDPEVIAATKSAGMISIPGFLTATEGFTAIRAGADYLKLFPAGKFGTGYIKDLKAVIKTPIMAVGGVSIENTAEFLQVCSGIGIGSTLYKPGKSLEGIAADAESFVTASLRQR
jgi:2-dehydro-3-deoxyphosphogalactonate aldolase